MLNLASNLYINNYRKGSPKYVLFTEPNIFIIYWNITLKTTQQITLSIFFVKLIYQIVQSHEKKNCRGFQYSSSYAISGLLSQQKTFSNNTQLTFPLSSRTGLISFRHT